MKRGLLFSFLLALLALLAFPALGLGLTWADYVTQVEAELWEQSGEVVLEVPSGVDPFLVDAESGLPRDALLTVPEGVSLVLTGGEVPGLLLGGGDITLRGLKVTGVAGAPSVYVMQQPKEKRPLQLSLIISEDTVVESADGSALGLQPNPLTAWTLTLENRGTVRSLSGAPAMDLPLRGARTLSLSLKNTGEISGGQGVRMDVRPSGNYWLLLQNDGEIAGASDGLAIDLSGRIHGDMFTLINGASGVIRCDAEGEAAIRFHADSMQGTVRVINDGLLQGGNAAISLACSRDKLLPVEVVNNGVMESADAEAAPMLLTVTQRVEKPKQILDDDGLRRELKPFLEASTFDSLPKGTKLRAVLNARVDGGEDIPGAAETVFASIQLVRPAIAWKDFVKQLTRQLTLAHGEVPVYPTQRVLATGSGDIPLVVPEGVHLRIVNGAFETMLLGSGHISLENTLVEIMEDGYTSIQIERKSDPMALTLTLDERTTVANYGLDGIGLGTGKSFHKDISIDITNHGTIECMMGQAVLLHPTADSKHSLTLHFRNDGKILGDTSGLTLRADTVQGEGSVSLWNAGTVETRSGEGASLTAASTDARVFGTVENTATGIIYSGEGPGLQVNLRESTRSFEDYDSLGHLHNYGLLEGASSALTLRTPPHHPVRMTLEGDGELRSPTGAAEVLVAFDQYLERRGTAAMDEAAFEASRTNFLEMLGVRYLPTEVQVVSHLLIYPRGASSAEPMLVQTAHGGGEELPEVAKK